MSLDDKRLVPGPGFRAVSERAASILDTFDDTKAPRDPTRVFEFLKSEGYIEHYYVGGLSRDRGIGTGNVLSNNWPVEYARPFFERKRFLDDPIVAYCKTVRTVATQADVAAALTASPTGWSRADEARSYGMALPALVVIRSGGYSIGCVSYRRAERFSPDELSLLATLAPPLHRVARAGYFASRSRSHDILSPRERECIAWSSVGKSSWEIGEILGIAKQTVDVHLKSAIQKLDAGSRAHAVAEALRLGLID